MCGIAGILKLDPRERAEDARLVRMRDALQHRGPDGAGLYIDGPVGLGHRRLSIVDVAGGHQPMANEDESVWIVFNGEIYNHAQLRPELERRGHATGRAATPRRSCISTKKRASDASSGCKACSRSRSGIAPNGRLLLARDRLGIKPLYYADTGHELLFASEIKGILAAGGVQPTLNDRIVPEFLATRFVSGEETFFRGIHKLLPGRTLSWSPGRRLTERRYWSLPVDGDGVRRHPSRIRPASCATRSARRCRAI